MYMYMYMYIYVYINQYDRLPRQTSYAYIYSRFKEGEAQSTRPFRRENEGHLSFRSNILSCRGRQIRLVCKQHPEIRLD